MSASQQEQGQAAGSSVDVIVIGAGPVGENVAQYAVEGGLSAVLVEHELLGGECSYYACMPSKALLRPLEVTAAAQNLPGVQGAATDVPGLLARRDDFVSHYDDASQVSWAEGAGVEVVRGHGELAGERLVRVRGEGGDRLIEARRAVVLATGSAATIPGIYEGLGAWTSRDATGVREVPQRLAIVGGGVVACEAAAWMAGLGSQVTMLVRGSSLLAGQEPFAGEHVADGLRAVGVEIRFGTEARSASRPEVRDTGLGRIHGGPVTLELDAPGSDGQTQFEADEVLVAAGRRPSLEAVGLDSVGMSADDVLEHRLPGWLHAVGDASGPATLTHGGKHDARVLGSRLAAEAGAPAEHPAPDQVPVPQVVFTDPQVAAVGRTEAEAREQGLDVVVARVPYGSAAGTALLRDDVDGTAQLVVDRAAGLVVGATFVGPEAAELLHAATIAIVGRVPVHLLRHATPAFPTASELWLPLLEQLPRELR